MRSEGGASMNAYAGCWPGGGAGLMNEFRMLIELWVSWASSHTTVIVVVVPGSTILISPGVMDTTTASTASSAVETKNRRLRTRSRSSRRAHPQKVETALPHAGPGPG